MSTRIAKKKDDPPPNESPNVSNGIQTYETWEDMRDSWKERAVALMEEMAGFGYCTVFAGCCFDTMDGHGGGTDVLQMYRGNHYATIGLLSSCLDKIHKEEL